MAAPGPHELSPHDLAELEGTSPSLAEPSPPDPAPATPQTRARRILTTLLNFTLGQGALQLVGVLGGLLLVRRLSVDSYAQLGLATAFQAVVAVLMDLGLASTIIPLVGDRRDDPALVGRYVRAAKHLRDRSFLIVAPLATLAILAILHRHGWSWPVQLALTASVLLALFSGGKVSYFSAPFFLFGRLREFYLPQVVSGTLRLLAYLVLSAVGALTAISAAALSALNVVLVGELLQRRSRPYLRWPTRDSPETDREVLRFMLPAAPASVFSAFQSQISLFLISVFGGTVAIAQVAALGRIGQLFAVLMTFNVIVIEPWVARLPRPRLLHGFLGLMLLASLCCLPLIYLGFHHPRFYLWILGAKYANLGDQMGFLILAACINFLAGLLWIMNRARKWLFWSGTGLEIALLLVVQIAFVARYGVRDVHQAVLFTFASSFCPAVAHAYVTLVGFRQQPSP